MPKFISNTVQVHVATYDIKEKEYKFLVLQRASNLNVYPNLWQVITGTIEENETALQTAKRETKEETGLEAKQIWTIPYITTFFDAGKDLIHFSPIFGILVDSSIVALSDEHQAYYWLDYKACMNKLELPTHKEGLRMFKDYILAKEGKKPSK